MTASRAGSLTVWLRAAASGVACLAIVVLVGYALHRPQFIHVAPGLEGMSVVTALGLLALSAGLIVESVPARRAALMCAATGAVLGAWLLLLMSGGGSDSVSPSLAHALFGFDPALAGRTSIATATCLSLLGAAAFGRRVPWLNDSLACIALCISGVALLGYFYGVQDLYAVKIFRSMALHTAAAAFVLSIVALMMRPNAGIAAIILSSGPGGRATRRQMTFAVIPPILGIMLTEAINAHRLGPAAAMAFLVALTIFPLALLILRDGLAIDELDAERRRRSVLQAALADDLRDKLAAQAAELARAGNERAKAEQGMYRAQRMEAMGQLTGGIAHDFNNLLMAIAGNLQLLLKRLPSDHAGRRFALNAQGATERGAKLAGQLLAFSRIQKLDIGPVEITAVLNVARTLVGASLGPDIVIETHVGETPTWALTDGDQLELAILNMALNARDAMPQGGRLTIESGMRLGKSAASSDDRTEWVYVRVRDTGTGMSPEVAARAVEPFFTTKERGRGSGLGLAQVYGFVRQCGGDVTIDSELGRGTTIELLFRQARPEEGSPERGEAATAAPADGVLEPQRALLLVIDDDDDVRAVLVASLRDVGFAVIEASNGVDGLKLMESHAPAAAVIDFLMPGLNGADVARQAQRRWPKLPIIFVSGYYDTIALDEIAGAVILRKPIDVVRLQKTVAAALQ